MTERHKEKFLEVELLSQRVCILARHLAYVAKLLSRKSISIYISTNIA